MKRSLLFLFVAMIVATSPGCSCMGINSQDDMRRYAIKRASDDEPTEKKAAAPVQKPPVKKETNEESSTADTEVKTRLPTSLADASKPAETAKDDAVNEPDTVLSEVKVDDPPAPEGELTEIQLRDVAIDRMNRIGEAIEKYVRDKGHFPQANIVSGKKPVLSWRVELLPYLGYQALYEKFDKQAPWDHPTNEKLLAKIPNIYQDAGRRDTKASHFTNFLAIASSGSVIDLRRARKPIHIEDGLDNTIMIVEANDGDAVPWTMPEDFNLRGSVGNVERLGRKRSDGTFVLWAGGLVSLIPKDTPNALFMKAASAEGGERFKLADLFYKASGDPSAVNATSLVTVVDNPGGVDAPIGADTPLVTTDSNDAASSPNNPVMSSRFPLYDFAIRAMSESRNRDASRYLHAAMLIDTTDEWTKRVKWSGGLRRPIAEVNWAVAATGMPNANPKGANKVADNKSNIVTGFGNATGELGKRFLELLYERADRGKFGPLIQGGVLSSKADVAKRADDDDEDNEYRSPNRGKIESKVSQEDQFSHTAAVFPGATIFTNQNERVLIELAKMREVDVLTVFQVTTKQTNRTGVKVTVQIKFIDGMTGELLDETESINNIEVRAARADPLRDDPTVALFEEIESLMRSKYDLTSVPDGLRSQHVRRRVGVILSRPIENPMRYLVELRYYYASELLTGDEYRQSVSQILGDDAELFLNGSPQEKLSVLLPWMPKEYLDMNE